MHRLHRALITSSVAKVDNIITVLFGGILRGRIHSPKILLQFLWTKTVVNFLLHLVRRANFTQIKPISTSWQSHHFTIMSFQSSVTNSIFHQPEGDFRVTRGEESFSPTYRWGLIPVGAPIAISLYWKLITHTLPCCRHKSAHQEVFISVGIHWVWYLSFPVPCED